MLFRSVFPVTIPEVINLSSDEEKIENKPNSNEDGNKLKNDNKNNPQQQSQKILDIIKSKFGKMFGLNLGVDSLTNNNEKLVSQQNNSSDQEISSNMEVTNVDSDFLNLTKKVIANFEGGKREINISLISRTMKLNRPMHRQITIRSWTNSRT